MDASVKAEAARQTGFAAMASGVTGATMLPIIRSITLGIILIVTPMILIFMPTAWFGQIVIGVIGLYVWVSLWGVIDVLLHRFAMDYAYRTFAEVRALGLGSAAIQTFSTSSLKTLSNFATMRWMAGGIAAAIGGMIGFKGSAALASMAGGMTNMQQSAAQRAGAMASPEGRAQILTSQEMSGATLANHGEYGAARYMDQMTADQRRRMEAYTLGEKHFGSGRALGDAGALQDFVSTVKGAAYATEAEKHLGAVMGRQSDQALKEAAAYDAVSVLAGKFGWSREETMQRLALGNMGPVGLNASEAPNGKAGVYSFGMDGGGNVVWSSGKAGGSFIKDTSNRDISGDSSAVNNSHTDVSGSSKRVDNTDINVSGQSIERLDVNKITVDKGRREKIGDDIRHGDTTHMGDNHTFKSESRGTMQSGQAAMALMENGVSGGLAVHAKGGDVTILKDPATGKAVSATMNNGPSIQSYNIADGLMTEKGTFKFNDPRTGAEVQADGEITRMSNGTIAHGNLNYSYGGYEVRQTLGTGGVETTFKATKGATKDEEYRYTYKEGMDAQFSKVAVAAGGRDEIVNLDKHPDLLAAVGVANTAKDVISGVGKAANIGRNIKEK